MTQIDQTLSALKEVQFPGLNRDIVTLGYVKDIQEVDGRSVVTIAALLRNEGAV